MSLTSAWKPVLLIFGVLWAATTLASGADTVDQGKTAATVATANTEVQREKVGDSEPFTPLTVREYFSCRIPARWWQEDNTYGLSAEEKKVFGVTLHAPESRMVPVKISVHYYAEGNLLYKSLDQFVTLHAQSIFGTFEGDRYGPVTKTTISGRTAVTFERRKNEFVATPNLEDPTADDGSIVYERRERMATPVSVTERFIAVPAKSGFYALRYSASTEDFPEFVKTFEQVTASFKALQ